MTKRMRLHRKIGPFILLKFMDENFTDLLDDAVVCKYPRFDRYIKAVYTDRNMWALCYRKGLPLSGNNTNNYCESQFLVLKDEVLNLSDSIFGRTKSNA